MSFTNQHAFTLSQDICLKLLIVSEWQLHPHISVSEARLFMTCIQSLQFPFFQKCSSVSLALPTIHIADAHLSRMRLGLESLMETFPSPQIHLQPVYALLFHRKWQHVDCFLLLLFYKYIHLGPQYLLLCCIDFLF